MANYTFYPEQKFTTLTFQELFALDLQELGMLGQYAQSGNADHLAMASPGLCAQYQAWVASCLKGLTIQLERVGSAQALGTMTTYRVDYSELGSDKTLVAFVTHSISPKPVSAQQLDVFKQGMLLSAEEWTYWSTGITLATALTTGEYVTLRVLSPELASAKSRFDFAGESGTGSGNRTWLLADLPADEQGATISSFPALPSRLEVYLNGLLCRSSGASPDYAVTGTGATTQVTFTIDIPADSGATFFIWSV